jgi:PHP-associated
MMHPGVTFARPDIETLRKGGYTPVDMHFHTRHTDGLVTIPALLARARARGIGCAVTDHNEISGAVHACRERGFLPIIPGIEISAADGPHLLLYFYSVRDLEDYFQRYIMDRRSDSPWLMTRLSTGEILEAAEGYACIRAPAHPYGYLIFNGGLGKCVDKGYLDRELYRQCEAIEGLCANMTHAENLRAIALALRLKIPVTGGSDGHVLSDLGTAVTCAWADTPEEFLDELRKGRARVIGREKHLPSKLITGAVISARFMPWFYPSLKIHCTGAGRRVHRYLSKRRQ